MCKEVRELGPKAGLHHDGVVFGSDDFCASIGSLSTLPSPFYQGNYNGFSLFIYLCFPSPILTLVSRSLSESGARILISY